MKEILPEVVITIHLMMILKSLTLDSMPDIPYHLVILLLVVVIFQTPKKKKNNNKTWLIIIQLTITKHLSISVI